MRGCRMGQKTRKTSRRAGTRDPFAPKTVANASEDAEERSAPSMTWIPQPRAVSPRRSRKTYSVSGYRYSGALGSRDIFVCSSRRKGCNVCAPQEQQRIARGSAQDRCGLPVNGGSNHNSCDFRGPCGTIWSRQRRQIRVCRASALQMPVEAACSRNQQSTKS